MAKKVKWTKEELEIFNEFAAIMTEKDGCYGKSTGKGE